MIKNIESIISTGKSVDRRSGTRKDESVNSFNLDKGGVRKSKESAKFKQPPRVTTDRIRKSIDAVGELANEKIKRKAVPRGAKVPVKKVNSTGHEKAEKNPSEGYDFNRIETLIKNSGKKTRKLGPEFGGDGYGGKCKNPLGRSKDSMSMRDTSANQNGREAQGGPSNGLLKKKIINIKTQESNHNGTSYFVTPGMTC